jgi:hypothetical protein
LAVACSIIIENPRTYWSEVPLLGGKIGIENFREIFCRYANALILIGDLHISAGLKKEGHFGIESQILTIHANGPSAGHGLNSI